MLDANRKEEGAFDFEVGIRIGFVVVAYFIIICEDNRGFGVFMISINN